MHFRYFQVAASQSLVERTAASKLQGCTSATAARSNHLQCRCYSGASKPRISRAGISKCQGWSRFPRTQAKRQQGTKPRQRWSMGAQQPVRACFHYFLMTCCRWCSEQNPLPACVRACFHFFIDTLSFHFIHWHASVLP